MAWIGRLYGITAIVLASAASAFGQAACAAPTAPGNLIRSEGTTEQVSALTFICTAPAGAVAGSAAIQVYFSPAVPVTSAVLAGSGALEAIVTVNGGPQFNGTIAGSTLTFSGVALPLLAPGDSYTFVISNVRVNATSVTVGSGLPPAIGETVFISGSAGSIVPAALGPTQVAFVQTGLAPAKLFNDFTVAAATFPNGAVSTQGSNNFAVCVASNPQNDAVSLSTAGSAAGKSLAFVVQVSENFVLAFKTAANEASQVTTTLASNAVLAGTRLAINFTGVPNNVSLYVPNGAISSTGAQAPVPVVPAAQIRLTASGAGAAFAAVSGSGDATITSGTGLTTANGLAPVLISGGSGSAVFEVTQSDAAIDTFNIPVFAVFAANAAMGTSTPIGVSVNFSPLTSAAVPGFSSGANTATINASTFNICNTSLLFPFVTNELGFDTGVAIANTSADPFGNRGAQSQSGSCTLNFYGVGAPFPNGVVTPGIPPGTTYVQVLSSVAVGFQGYMIAQCQFQYAHGFAFITNGIGTNGGLSQGYLASIIPDSNQIVRSASPLGIAGTGESLGN